jgi:glycine/D-amino acid oxidase-like deaminating enzyme
MPPDHRLVIGWGATVEGFLHVAGLGGHGVTVSHAIGLLAAKLILRRSEQPVHAEFAPFRFHSTRDSRITEAGGG